MFNVFLKYSFKNYIYFYLLSKITIIKKTEKGHRPFSVIFIDYERESAVTETFAHGFGTS